LFTAPVSLFFHTNTFYQLYLLRKQQKTKLNNFIHLQTIATLIKRYTTGIFCLKDYRVFSFLKNSYRDMENELLSRQSELRKSAKINKPHFVLLSACIIFAPQKNDGILIETLMLDFTAIIDYLGTFAFAISGIRLASAKQFDWFGAYIVGLVTAIGGGTIRDLLLGITPFWMQQPSYLIVTAFALVFVIVFSRYVIRLNNTFFIFDAIGLGLFVTVGIQRTLDAGFPFWVAIVMGMITGSAGGVMRDIFINEAPLIFRKDIYALACIFGGAGYYICVLAGFPQTLTQIVTIISVILIRILAVKYHIGLPILKGIDEKKQE
jgi:uncharacterized membrane protein YeiH